ENLLIGQMYELNTTLDAFPIVVGDASSWVYAGTGLATGDTLPHLLGYEWDHAWSGGPAVDIFATSPAIGKTGRTGDSNLTAYYPTESSVVFSAGTIEWSWGLARPGYADARVEKITENVLGRAGVTPDSELVVSPPPASVDVGDAVDVSLVAGSGVAGYLDGPAALAQFNTPAGVAVDASGTVYVTEARNHRVRKITPDGMVSTLAGCGPDDSVTGDLKPGFGTNACFDLPLGIVAAPDGTIYVADSGNNRVRAIDTAGYVSTFAGNGRKGTNDDRHPRSAGIAVPRSLALGPDGSLYVTTNGGDIRRIGKDGVTTILHDPLMENSGVSVGPDGSVYVLSTTRGNVSVIKDGALVPLMNPAETVGDKDGASNVAELRPVEGLGIFDQALYVADTGNYKVRRVSLLPGHVVTTFVGNGRYGSVLGTGATTNLVNPRGIAVTPSGMILIADSANHRILRAVAPPSAAAPPASALH
ncbi:MAG TPA: N,N-dimethylformamidase beta subunit family domain-containing protein, partial [Polyangiaceae bacterium]